jgi:hypothetical protein
MILVGSSQPEHFLVLPELKTKVRIGNGSIVALASPYLDHFVHGTKGSNGRVSLLFISGISTARYLNIALPLLA